MVFEVLDQQKNFEYVLIGPTNYVYKLIILLILIALIFLGRYIYKKFWPQYYEKQDAEVKSNEKVGPSKENEML